MSYEDQFALQQRRNFLKFIGKAGIALPLLQASSLGAGLILARQAEAAGSVLRKVIFVHIPEGTPAKASATYTPDANLVLKTCSKPLELVKNECVFIDKMNVEGGGGHGLMQRVLGAFQKTGFSGGNTSSIDLAFADTIGATSPISVLHLGVRTKGLDPISARGFTQNFSFQDNPKAAFDRLFGGAVDASPIGSKRDKKMHDTNLLALTKLQTKLGTYEIARLNEHQAAVEKLKADIDASSNSTALAGCTSPTFNAEGRSIELADSAFTDIFALQTDNLILSMRCNITRVGVLQIGNTQADFAGTGLTGDFHGSVHSGSQPFFEQYRTYLSERVAYLINKLKTTDDGYGGKMIDSTLVVQVTDMSNGSDHTADDAPFMLAGGGSAVKRGTIVSVADAGHYRLLDTVALYMGVNGSIKPYDDAGALSGILV